MKPAAKPDSKPTSKVKGSKRKARLAHALKLLNEAHKASRQAQVKHGITSLITLVQQGRYDVARDRAGELKRTAALAGESAAAVLKLVDVEDALTDLALRGKKRGPKP